MDRIVLLAATVAAAIAIGVSVGVYAAPEMKPMEPKSEERVGGWTQPASPTMTKEAKTAFDKAMEGVVGVSYRPVELLGTQVVAGTNYRILCDAQVVYPGTEPYQAVVTIYQDLDGNVEILEITDLKE